MATSLIHRDSINDRHPALGGAAGVTTATVGGITYLFVAGYEGDGAGVFRIEAGGGLTEVATVGDDGALEIAGANSVATAEVGGVTYLFVAGYDDGGISVFEVGADGSLAHADTVADDATLNLSGAASLATATVGGVTYLFAAGQFDSGLSVFGIGADGSLTSVENIADDATLELDNAYFVTTAVVGGVTYLFAAGFGDDGIAVFSVGADGSLANVDNVTDNAVLELDGLYSLATAVVGGVTYLFAAGNRDDGVSVFSVAADGTLTSVQNVADDATLNLDGAASVATDVVGGVAYLFVAGFIDNGLSVFSVGAGGLLTNVANVADTGGLSLGGVIAVTTEVIGGVTYLSAAGFGDSGVSVFSVGADGALTNVDDVPEPERGLDGLSSIATAVVGGVTYVFTAGYEDNAVGVFRVESDGTLASVGTVSDDATLSLLGPTAVATATIGSVTYLFAAGDTDHGISVFSVGAGGTLTNVDNVFDDPTLNLSAVYSLAVAELGGTTYLFAAGPNDHGLSVFSVGADGSLVNVDNVADDLVLNLAAVDAVATARVGGATYLFAAGFLDDGVSVFSVGADGSLSNVANVADDATLNLNGAAGLAAAEVGGVTYLFVAGFVDDGLSVFSVGADGSLTNVDNVGDDATLHLDGVYPLATATRGGVTYLFAAGAFDDGLSVFTVGADGSLTNVANLADDRSLPFDYLDALAVGSVDGAPYLFAGGYFDDGISSFAIAPDLTFTIAPVDATAQEGPENSTTRAHFVVSRAGDLAFPASVDWALAPPPPNALDAASLSDFSGAVGGTVSFAAGEATKTIFLDIAGDLHFEADERFSVVLSNPSAGEIGPAAAMTILDEDPATPDPVFQQGAFNPFGISINFSLLPAGYPVFVDIDGDGDLDLFNSNLWQENVGTATAPDFAPPDATPLRVSTRKRAFGDLDGDGDLDIVTAARDGSTSQIAYDENTGTAAAPAFGVPRVFSPFGLDPALVGQGGAAFDNGNPSLADIDDDGDLDLFVVASPDGSTASGTVFFVENTGTATAADFSTQADFDPFGIGGISTGSESLTFLDADGDGDLDLAVNQATGLDFYENIGSQQTPVFARPAVNPLAGFNANGGQQNSAAAADIDGDGDIDLFGDGGDPVTFESGLRFFENVTPTPSPGPAVPPVVLAAPTFTIAATRAEVREGSAGATTPVRFVVSRTGDLTGAASVDYALVQQPDDSGAATAPDFAASQPLSGTVSFAAGESVKVITLDVAGDAFFEGDETATVALSGPSAGATGAAASIVIRNDDRVTPVFQQGPDNPFGLDISYGLTTGGPALADIDLDGDLDLFADIRWQENIGAPGAPAFAPGDIASNPLRIAVGTALGRDIGFGDIDADGDLDYFAPRNGGTVAINIGDARHPTFANYVQNPFGLAVTGWRSAELADIDSDGDLDLFVMRVNGGNGEIVFAENIGTATSPDFNPPGGTLVDPFGLSDPGGLFLGAPDQPTVRLSDLDRDGDLDALVTNLDGAFYFENVGTPEAPSFQMAAENPFAAFGLAQASDEPPLLADIDGDGDDDLLASPAASGELQFFENVTPRPLVGSAGNDALNGTAGGDAMRGLAGDDRISGHGGGDLLEGGSGADILVGGAGDDRLSGNGGNDLFYIDSLGDRVEDSGGNDELRSSVSVDLNDTARFIGSLETVRLLGSGAIDATGNGRDERLYGTIGGNVLTGNGGNDILLGGAGNDTMRGGSGNDIYYVSDAGDVVDESGGGGVDEIRATVSIDLSDATRVLGTIELVRLLNGAGIDATGNGLANRLIGNTAGNILAGNGGNDVLIGGAGGDTLRGGAGNDLYYLDHPGDVVDEIGGGGTDEIRSTVSVDLSDPARVQGAIEIVRLTNGASIDATGDSLANTLYGNARSNILTGNGGADRFVFNTTLNAVTNVDTITDFSAIQDTMFLENARFTAFATAGTMSQADYADHIVYDAGTGALSYDHDGIGGDAAVQFALLDSGPAITRFDFVVI